jgi:hypothetical protein
MRRLAPLGYWMLQLVRAGCALAVLWALAILLAFFTVGGVYAVIALLVAFIHLAILGAQGWTRYYSGRPLNSKLAYPENDQ